MIAMMIAMMIQDIRNVSDPSLLVIEGVVPVHPSHGREVHGATGIQALVHQPHFWCSALRSRKIKITFSRPGGIASPHSD